MSEENTNDEKATLAITPEFKGAFFESLNRNNKAIKQDRAIAITEEAEILFKREIEDMKLKRKQLVRERANMLDLSASDKNSLILASDFDAKEFVRKDIEIGVKIRNLDIQIEIAEGSYRNLFS